MRLKRARILSLSTHAIFVICVSIVMASVNSCSSKTQDSVEKTEFASPSAISPEQCETLYKVHESASEDSGYLIQQGDQLDVEFYLNSEFNDSVTVDPEGRIALRLVGQLHAAGQTPEQLATAIDKAYQSELRNPGAVVHVHNMPGRQVYVEGEVTKPGAFPLQPGMTVVQAVALAGGTTDNSAPNNTVLIRHDACGEAQGSEVRLAMALKNPGDGDDVALMSQDVVVVPRSRIANIDLFVKQYIKGVLPIEPYLNMPM
jgi:protein involved in polysaccharide export with SLBB domain